MNCKEIQDNLSAYIDKALPEKEMVLIEEHLSRCPECLEEYEAIKDTINMISSLEEIIPPASFRRELRQKLEKAAQKQEKPSVQGLIHTWLSKLRISGLMPVAAALILMLAIVPFMADNIKMGAPQSKQEAGRGMDENLKTKMTYSLADKGVAPNVKDPAPHSYGVAMDQQIQMKNEASMPAPAPLPAAPGVTVKETEKAGAVGTQEASIDRKLIKNADISLRVDNYQAAVESLKNQVLSYGGYITNESVQTTGPEGILNGHLQVRVPQDKFDTFLSGMEGLGKVTGRNIYAQDVTEEYVDVQSRLKAYKTKEERLLAILQKSGQLSDILAVENELANTRAQIEAMEGRLRYLDNRTDFSTIGINIQQTAAPTQKVSTGGLQGVFGKAKEAFIRTINNILLGIGKLIVSFSSALPYLVLIALGLGAGWWWFKKRYSSQK
jgi:hypothetical protein